MVAFQDAREIRGLLNWLCRSRDKNDNSGNSEKKNNKDFYKDN